MLVSHLKATEAHKRPANEMFISTVEQRVIPQVPFLRVILSDLATHGDVDGCRLVIHNILASSAKSLDK